MDVPDPHYSLVAPRLAAGAVIPFLGAGANMCDRPDDAPWAPGHFLPSGGELARLLADSSAYPDPDKTDLLRISQYVEAVLGAGDLYESLHAVFDVDYPLTTLHLLLGRLAKSIQERGGDKQLVVLTTNYDDLVERAFVELGVEKFDVVWYEAKPGESQGCFVHGPSDGEPVVIDLPGEYVELDAAKRPLVVKLHGAIARGRPDTDGDSYVVTEDSYVAYLSHRDVGEQLPLGIRRRMEKSHFLFLGYSMRDWNLRVILNRIWGARKLDIKSWAVQRAPSSAAALQIEQALWKDREVDVKYVELKDYVAGIEHALAATAAG